MPPCQAKRQCYTVCRPDVHWAAIRLGPLPAAMSAVLSDCGLAPELTDTDAGYELFRKQS